MRILRTVVAVFLHSLTMIYGKEMCATLSMEEKTAQNIADTRTALQFRIVNRCAAVGLRNITVTAVSARNNPSALCYLHVTQTAELCTKSPNCSCEPDGTFRVLLHRVPLHSEDWQLVAVLQNGETLTVRISEGRDRSTTKFLNDETQGSKDRFQRSSTVAYIHTNQSKVVAAASDTTPMSSTATINIAHEATEPAVTNAQSWTFGIIHLASIGGGLFLLVIILICLLHCRLISRMNSAKGRQLINSAHHDQEASCRRSKLAHFRQSTVLAARLLLQSDRDKEPRERRVYHETVSSPSSRTFHQDSRQTRPELHGAGHATTTRGRTQPLEPGDSGTTLYCVSPPVRYAAGPGLDSGTDDSYLSRPVFRP